MCLSHGCFALCLSLSLPRSLTTRGKMSSGSIHTHTHTLRSGSLWRWPRTRHPRCHSLYQPAARSEDNVRAMEKARAGWGPGRQKPVAM